jgi:hypothetical protein
MKKGLLLSGETMTNWDVESVLTPIEPTTDYITRLIDEEWLNTYSTCGLTYGEINELDTFKLR